MLDSIRFSGATRFGRRAHESASGRHPGARVEIAHLVVEEEACARHHDARAVALLDRRREGDASEVAIHDRDVRRFCPLRGPFEPLGRRVGRFRERDRPPQLGCPTLGCEAVDGDRREVGVAEEQSPVRERAAHALGEEVHLGRAAYAHRTHVVRFKQVEHLDDGRSARARRGHADELHVAVGASHRLSLFRPILSQVVVTDEPAVRLHLAHEEVCRLAFVKTARPLIADALESAREIFLNERVARLERNAAPCELRLGGGLLVERWEDLADRLREALRHGKSLRGEVNGGLDQLGPGELSEARVSQMEASHRAGHADGQDAPVVAVRVVAAVRLREHLRHGGQRRLLAEVEGRRATVGHPDDQETPAAHVAGRG
jgi:hypothetical protein